MASTPVFVTSVAAASIASFYFGMFMRSVQELPAGAETGTEGEATGTKQRRDEDKEEHEDEDGLDSEDEAAAQAITAPADTNEECKLVLVVRTDLGMTKGKIAAQCSHATLACYKTLSHISSPILRRWERLGQAKIAVQCRSEDELLTLQATAMSLGVCARVVHDAGRTQIAAGSATVLGVGPAPKSLVDQVTGKLKLL